MQPQNELTFFVDNRHRGDGAKMTGGGDSGHPGGGGSGHDENESDNNNEVSYDASKSSAQSVLVATMFNLQTGPVATTVINLSCLVVVGHVLIVN